VFQGQALWLSAVYEDKYVRQDGQWLYQHLKLNIRFQRHSLTIITM
jgi:hypothetical protein